MCRVAGIRIFFSIPLLTQVLLTPFQLEGAKLEYCLYWSMEARSKVEETILETLKVFRLAIVIYFKINSN